MEALDAKYAKAKNFERYKLGSVRTINDTQLSCLVIDVETFQLYHTTFLSFMSDDRIRHYCTCKESFCVHWFHVIARMIYLGNSLQSFPKMYEMIRNRDYLTKGFESGKQRDSRLNRFEFTSLQSLVKRRIVAHWIHVWLST